MPPLPPLPRPMPPPRPIPPPRPPLPPPPPPPRPQPPPRPPPLLELESLLLEDWLCSELASLFNCHWPARCGFSLAGVWDARRAPSPHTRTKPAIAGTYSARVRRLMNPLPPTPSGRQTLWHR